MIVRVVSLKKYIYSCLSLCTIRIFCETAATRDFHPFFTYKIFNRR